MSFNTVYNIVLTADNIEKIVAAAAEKGWTLDHLQDNYEEYTDHGATLVLYLSVHTESGRILNCNDVPFYDMSWETTPHTELETFLSAIRGK